MYSNKNIQDYYTPQSSIVLSIVVPDLYDVASELSLTSIQSNQKTTIYNFSAAQCTDSRLYISKTPYVRFNVQNLNVITESNKNNISALEQIDLFKKVVGFLDSKLAAYPQENLLVTNTDLNKYPIYGLNIIPDFLARTTDHIVYFDQITFNAGTVTLPLTTLSLDFETATAFAADSGSVYTDLVTNDLTTTGINLSAKVGQASMVNNGSWANTQLVVNDGLDLSGGDRGFSLMVKGPRAVSVKLKLEGGTPTEQDASYTATNAWQRLTWDFSSDTAVNHNKIVLFFDIQGAASATATDDIFMIDNLEFRAFSALAVNKSTANSIKMHPNPASGIVKFSKTLGDALSVSVFDLLGKQVIPVQTIKSELNISALNPGMYFVNMVQGASSVTKKLLVN